MTHTPGQLPCGCANHDGGPYSPDCQQMDALFEAAPDMLAALRLAHRHPERQHEPGEMPGDCTICTAIARATGREG